MVKKKNTKQKEQPKPPPKALYEESEKFKALDRMMRSNKGIRFE